MAKQRKRLPKMDIQIMYFRPKRSPKDLRSEFLLPPPSETETNETASPEWKVKFVHQVKVK
jgi:hypothetical protein